DKAVRQTALHRHARGQLFGAYQGLLTVQAGDRQWVAPAAHALWVPPDCPHGLRSHGPYAGYSVYLSAAACAGLPDAPCALQASALLLAAVERAAGWRDEAWDAARLRIVELIRDEIRTLPRAGDGLTLPRDPRLQRLARRCRIRLPTRARWRHGRTGSAWRRARWRGASRPRPA
ncbi:AraC family ligand binding domain-containing protein, partial [Achromobacter xylosoxidans]